MRHLPHPPHSDIRVRIERVLCMAVGLLLPLGLVQLAGCNWLPTAEKFTPLGDTPGSSIGATTLARPADSSGSVKARMNPETPGLLKLNHHYHIEEEGIECLDCHEVGSSGMPSFPDHGTCSVCHDIDMDAPTDDCMLCHVIDPVDVVAGAYEEVEVLHVPEHSGEYRFDHSRFAEDSDKCTQCHTGVTSSRLTTDDNRGNHKTLFPGVQAMGMDTKDCQLCHTDMSRTEPPSSHHRPGFMKTHGQDFRAGEEGLCLNCHVQNDCDSCHSQMQPESHQRPEWLHSHGKLGTFNQDQCLMCHGEQMCQACHSTMMPKDHTNFFRRRSHGKIAAWDRDRCLNCHKQDYCEACHVGSSPLITTQPFHTPGANCLACHSPASTVKPLRRHGPLPNRSCTNCHQFQ